MSRDPDGLLGVVRGEFLDVGLDELDLGEDLGERACRRVVKWRFCMLRFQATLMN